MKNVELAILADAERRLNDAGFATAIIPPPAGVAMRCVIGGDPRTYVFVSDGRLHFSPGCAWAPGYAEAIFADEGPSSDAWTLRSGVV